MKKKYSYELFCWAYNLAAMQKFISLIDEFYFLTKLDKDYWLVFSTNQAKENAFIVQSWFRVTMSRTAHKPGFVSVFQNYYYFEIISIIPLKRAIQRIFDVQ